MAHIARVKRVVKKVYYAHCKCDFIAKLTDLRRHVKSGKQKKAASRFVDVTSEATNIELVEYAQQQHQYCARHKSS